MFAILGPTASGKSAVAMEVAKALDGDIWSVDSMQVYRGMDIGTAKASPADRAAVPHHLIDLADPEHAFTVAEFQQHGAPAIRGTQRAAIVCGGSGLHFRALVDPLEFPPTDPEVRSELEAMPNAEGVSRLLAMDENAGEHVDLANPRRVVRALEVGLLTGRSPSMRAVDPRAIAVRHYESDLDVSAVGIDPGTALRDRIAMRVDAMLQAGFLDEVAELAPRLGVTAAQAVGYKELLGVVRGETRLDEARDAAIASTARLAKRQRTYFRKDPRIRWLTWHDDVGQLVRQAIESSGIS